MRMLDRLLLSFDAAQWYARHPSDLWGTRLGRWWCGRRGHPGVFWFNPGYTEPDYHCTRCGEDLA